jgi:hypothetical protein
MTQTKWTRNNGKMRQQIHSQNSQSEASLFLGLIQQNKFPNSSQKWTIIRASGLQVLGYHLQVEFTILHSQVNLPSAFKCSYKCSLSNRNFNIKKKEIRQ